MALLEIKCGKKSYKFCLQGIEILGHSNIPFCKLLHRGYAEICIVRTVINIFRDVWKSCSAMFCFYE